MTYDSIGPLDPADDAAYTSLQKPDGDYEEVAATAPVYSN